MNTNLICEIGLNHNGSFKNALSICESLTKTDIWGVKFQYRGLKNYFKKKQISSEIGKEIIDKEVKKNYLTPIEIKKLSIYLRKKGIKTGISFFSKHDINDFKNFNFDFYKIPSVVCDDFELIKELKKKKKLLFISLGAKQHKDILRLKKYFLKILNKNNTVFFHCVTNYPLNPLNSNLSYIDQLKRIFRNYKIGYSSHEEEIYNSIISLSKNIFFLERHVTLSKYLPGLDHSSSSELKEIKKLAFYCKNYNKIAKAREKKTLNQGELINLQNLGKSYVFTKNLKKGDRLSKNILDEIYCMNSDRFILQDYVNQRVNKNISAGEILSSNHFKKNF